MSEVRLSNVLGPAFYQLAHDVFLHGHTHYDLSGGRGSLKSSGISLLVPLILLTNPNTHALVLRKVANTIRDSEQYETKHTKFGIQVKTESALLEAFCNNLINMGFTNDPSEVFWVLCINPLLSEEKKFHTRYSWEDKLNA